MQNVGISLCRMWGFHYAECRNFIMQIVFFWHKASMYVIEKSKGNDVQSGTKHNFGYFQESFPGLKP